MGKKATRDAYGEALAEFGGDKRIVVLDADLSKSTKTDTFRQVYPERHLNIGIAEGNMMSVAAGLATTGKIVFASSFAIFAAERGCEQIRNSICYPRLNVKIAATHAGLTVGEDGASHQCLEDIAIMRAMPNMTVLCPCDAAETRFAIKAAIEHDGPAYIRLGRLSVEEIYTDDSELELGKGILLKDEGNDAVIVATGLMVQEAMTAVEILKQKGYGVKLVDIHTIKPIDKELLVRCAKETGTVVTVEEHNITGGLGGAVCEALSDTYPCYVKRVGVEESFGTSGTPKELLKKYGLTAEDISEKVINAIKRER